MLPYIDIFGKSFPMYGVCIMLGILSAALFLAYDCKKNNVLWANAVIIGMFGTAAGFLGAKLLYIFVTYAPSEIVGLIKSGIDISDFGDGFVFYGGLIGGFIGAWIGAKILRVKLHDYENVLVKIIPLVHGFGRLGCFFGGCCYGKPTDSFLGIAFENPLSDAPVNVPLIPVQLYESGVNFILFFVLLYIDRKYPRNRMILPVYISVYAIERFIFEIFRYDEIRGVFLGLSTSQWISVFMFIIGVVLIRKRKVYFSD